MIKNKPSVSIAVCAYNEENNIKLLLNSLLEQNLSNCLLENIIVVSDGSIDNTNAIVQTFNKNKIILAGDSQRKGKSTRVNELFKNIDSDYLIIVDADVILATKNTLYYLIEELNTNSKISACSGNSIPLKQDSFIGQAIYCTRISHQYVKNNLGKINNGFSVTGMLTIYRKNLYKKTILPSNVLAEDWYMFLNCLQNNFLFSYASQAEFYFQLPQNLSDHIVQNVRYMSTIFKLKTYFPQNLIDKYARPPRKIFLKAMMQQFIKYPLNAGLIFVINRYCRYLAMKNHQSLSGKWVVSHSTKIIEVNL